MAPSETIMDLVFKRSQKLRELAPQLDGCHVVIEAASHGSQRRIDYRVAIHLTGGTDAETRTTRQAESDVLSVALRQAFDAIKRQLTARDKSPRATEWLTLEAVS
jgi:hypothetical protein